MSIISEINRIKTNIANAYNEAEEKGAEMPQIKNSNNLINTIRKIPVPVPPVLQDKTIEITTNGTTNVEADEGFDGLNSVEVITNVEGGGDDDDVRYTGHYDVEGLKTIGWTDEEIQYYQENGVYWNSEDDDCFLVPDWDKTSTNQSSIKERVKFIQKPTRYGYGNFNSYPSLIGIPKNAYAGSAFNSAFLNCYALKIIPEIDTSNMTDARSAFYGCHSLKKIPLLDTGKITIMGSMFYNCYDLKEIPLLNTENVTTMASMFYGCHKLKNIPELNTKNVTDMSNMFNYCYSLKEIPELDCSKVTTMLQMFANCYNLKSVALKNTNVVNTMRYMFNNCLNLEKISLFNTEKVTTMYNAFASCRVLKTIPQFDTRLVTDMSSMFSNCTNLISIPQLNTSNVTAMSSMFSYCYNLQKIPELDCGKVNNISNIFSSCYNLNQLGGFKDLGKAYTSSANASACTLNLSSAEGLTHDSLMNVINKLYDLTGKAQQTLNLGTTNKSKLSADEIAIATNKNWKVT